jgi:uncharacterized membrane protein
MTVPIIMLILLVAPYGVLRLLTQFTERDFDLRHAGAIGLTLLFILTGIGHFTDTDSMAQMLPPLVPGRVAIVYLTGLLEFGIAGGFLFRKTRRLTGWITAVLLVLFFPANIYAAINQVPQGGHVWGPVYLLIRAPVQLIILAWVYWFSIKPAREAETGGR